MKPGDTIVLTRVGNGVLVRPDIAPNLPWSPAEFQVFQEVGFGCGGDPGNPETLLSFLERHFRVEPKP